MEEFFKGQNEYFERIEATSQKLDEQYGGCLGYERMSGYDFCRNPGDIPKEYPNGMDDKQARKVISLIYTKLQQAKYPNNSLSGVEVENLCLGLKNALEYLQEILQKCVENPLVSE